MARINLTHHWKFRQLARALGSPVLALGTLELLWRTAYEHADDYIGTPADIAEAVYWVGPPTDLVRLLTSCGFLDADRDRYRVHDLWTHAPKYARLRWTRAHPGEIRPWNAKATSAVPQTGTYPPRPAPSRPAPPHIKNIAANAASNLRVLVRLAHVLADQRFETEADRKEALKSLAAQNGVPYDSRLITKAIDVVRHNRTPMWVAHPQAALVRRMKRRQG
jgi:hypothetical protein